MTKREKTIVNRKGHEERRRRKNWQKNKEKTKNRFRPTYFEKGTEVSRKIRGLP
jgi:hypothetical protein